MARFGVKEVADCTFYNLLTGKADLYLDTLKLSNLENNAESSYATGGAGASRLVGWDYGRTSVFNIQDALLNPKAIAMQTGTELKNQIETIYKRVKVTPVLDTGGTKTLVKLPKKPKLGTIQIYTTKDGYEQLEDLSEKTFDIVDITDSQSNVIGVNLEFDTADLPVNPTEKLDVIVYFQYETTAKAEVITIKSDKFAGYYKVIGDTLWRNEATGQDEMVQLVIPKAKITSSFTLTMQPDGEPSVKICA